MVGEAAPFKALLGSQALLDVNVMLKLAVTGEEVPEQGPVLQTPLRPTPEAFLLFCSQNGWFC